MSDRQLPSRYPRTLHEANLAHGEYTPGGDDRQVADLDTANVISSLDSHGGTGHYPVLDIDIPAALVPSSTKGHSHLYLDRWVSDADYWELLDVLARVGILQPGYVAACKSRGYTSVRLPWVKKGDAES